MNVQSMGSAACLVAHLYGPSHTLDDIGLAFMASYSTFMDGSGKPSGKEKWCVVAGFLATVEKWDAFEVAWNAFLAKHSIAYLQMSSLHARSGIFKDPKWDWEPYMISFLSEASQIIRACALKWGADLVSFADFEKAATVYPGLLKYTNPYGLCGTAVALRLQMPKVLEVTPQRLAIEHFFEEGDAGICNIEHVFARCGMQRPIVRPGKPRKDDPMRRYYVHFQAADWLAFETRKLVEREDKEGRKRIRSSHVSLLKGIPGQAKKWKYEDLLTFCAIKRSRGQIE